MSYILILAKKPIDKVETAKLEIGGEDTVCVPIVIDEEDYKAATRETLGEVVARMVNKINEN